ncbi:MAG TPA: DUF6502 family protein [Steroidobacteraceae bacterium]|nr:DUF6502 family protein [Steroidobacteraceae bacterium]
MNHQELRAAALSAVAQIVTPLARLLLDAGVSARDFQEIARIAFIEAALAKGAASNPPDTSDSHIGVVTGMSRRDVAALRARMSSKTQDEQEIGRHRAEIVLQAWVSGDTNFQVEGEPARLPIRGPHRSFSALVKKHSPDPRPTTILRDLLRVKAVRCTPDGQVEVIRKAYAPQTFSPEGIREVGQQCHEHLQSLIHNLHHPRRAVYQRRLINRRLTRNQAAIIARNIVMTMDAAMDSVESALSDPPLDQSDVSNVDSVLGVGLYLIQEPAAGEPELLGRTAAEHPPKKRPAGRKTAGRARRTRHR